MKPLILFLVGPTAVGKSEIALLVADQLDGEIISADSMQVYKGMNIGTAKPSNADLAKVPHHLIDICEPTEDFSVYDYRTQALEKIREILARKKVPIVVGGTGLYVRSLIQGISKLPGASAEIRSELEREAQENGTQSLYKKLQECDPLTAEKIHPEHTRRIIRALEIYKLSGTPASKLREKNESLEDLGYEALVVGIDQEREVLYAKVNQRVDRMFDSGLREEVKQLAKKQLSKTAYQAVGYKELIEAYACPDEGEASQAEIARELIKRNSRHLAKRQWTWFKRERGIRWLNRRDFESSVKLSDEICALYEQIKRNQVNC